MSKFEVGDRVVPRSKSSGLSLEDSIWIKAKNPYLFVTGRTGKEDIYCSLTRGGSSELFIESDLILYEEVQARIEPAENAPVYYTLPKPVDWTEIKPLIHDPLKFTPYESEYPIQPDYKGFYEFIDSIHLGPHKGCPPGTECSTFKSQGCANCILFYAEKKFIKKEIK
jgi:hypothetical protein